MFINLSCIFFGIFLVNYVYSYSSAFDHDLYERVLDTTLCDRQLTFISNDSLGMQFLDAGAKFPSGILLGNMIDLGNYFECLNIFEVREDMVFEGKYSIIKVPLEQNPVAELPVINATRIEDVFENIREAVLEVTGVMPSNERSQRKVDAEAMAIPGGSAMESALTLAMCIPKVCPVRQAVGFYLDRLIFLNVTYREGYSRLKNDKPMVAADYVAIVLFSIIGLLTIASTSYDLHQIFFMKQEAAPLYRSFSVYTNTRRFLSFPATAGSLDCLDGIRTISMMWVVIGHVFAFTYMGGIQNPLDVLKWIQSSSSIWITSAPITVDTFFLLSGILCVYSTLGKISRSTFIRNIHIFYLNRLLRMFPLLATVVLLQASWANHASDGPQWPVAGGLVEQCRKNWWTALLHVQNYVNTSNICLGQTWYLSVDIQLYIASPLVLLWLFGKKTIAWSALVVAILVTLVSSSAYVFVYNFPGFIVSLSRFAELMTYMKKYYFNTLTRAPPFAVGLLYGYLLHTTKGKTIQIPTMHVILLWILSFLMMALAIVPVYSMSQMDYNNQAFDNFFNAYVRAIWAGGLGWLIFACVHGYGGPINWFLSLSMWKLPARLSYAIYLVHFPIITVANASWVDTQFFSTGVTVYRFFSDLAFTMLVSLVLCIFIDAPCSTLQKMLLGKGRRRRDHVTSVVKDKEPNAANIET